jgi:hypothetical protein
MQYSDEVNVIQLQDGAWAVYCYAAEHAGPPYFRGGQYPTQGAAQAAAWLHCIEHERGLYRPTRGGKVAS